MRAFRGAEEAVFFKDAHGRYLTINESGARMLGRTPSEVIGRTDFGIFEIIEMTSKVRDLITAHTDSEVIHRAAVDAGMMTMVEDAIIKCRMGVTSAAEVLRVATVGA